MPIYISTSEWRKKLDLNLSPGDRQNNAAIIGEKDQSIREAIAKSKAIIDRKYMPMLLQSGSRKHTKDIERAMKSETKLLEKHMTKSIRAPAGKITFKHVSVAYVNRTFGLSLTTAENDIADAICLGACWFAGNIKQEKSQ